MSELAPPPADAPLILVADDVPANVELLFDQLHVLGFRAIAAYDGPSALAACAELHPDLCILTIDVTSISSTEPDTPPAAHRPAPADA